VQSNFSVVFLDDLLNDEQPQALPFVRSLGGEEGIEDLADDR
jgi:hypothetical protein